MLRWQDAQVGLGGALRAARASTSARRPISSSSGTSGGGGGGVPRMFCSTYLPRITGEVRVG